MYDLSVRILISELFFFFQAEDGIRYYKVTGVQTCALPICTFVGTLTFGASIDGTNYDAAGMTPIAGGATVTTATAPGAWVPVPSIKLYGARYFRLRMTAYTSGTAGVEITTTATARA